MTTYHSWFGRSSLGFIDPLCCRVGHFRMCIYLQQQPHLKLCSPPVVLVFIDIELQVIAVVAINEDIFFHWNLAFKYSACVPFMKLLQIRNLYSI